MWRMLSMVLLLYGVGIARCDDLSIEKMREICGSRESHGQALCAAYLMGIVHGLQIASWKNDAMSSCIPATISSDQAIEMFSKYANGISSEMLRKPAATFWATILAAEFPCPRSK